MNQVLTNDVLPNDIVAADVVTDGDNVYIKGAPSINTASQGYSVTKQSYVAPVARQITVGFTAANNTTYEFTFKQELPGQTTYFTFTYTSDSTATATEIASAINTSFAQYKSGGTVDVTTSGAGTPVTFVGGSISPLFTIVGVSNVTVTTTVPGNVEINNGTQLKAQGILDAVPDVEYTTWTVNFSDPSTQMTVLENQLRTEIMALDEAAADFAAVETAIDAAL